MVLTERVLSAGVKGKCFQCNCDLSHWWQWAEKLHTAPLISIIIQKIKPYLAMYHSLQEFIIIIQIKLY